MRSALRAKHLGSVRYMSQGSHVDQGYNWQRRFPLLNAQSANVPCDTRHFSAQCGNATALRLFVARELACCYAFAEELITFGAVYLKRADASATMRPRRAVDVDALVHKSDYI